MTTRPVAGDFLEQARQHIAAAVSFRGYLSYDAQRDAARQLCRLTAAMARLLADLPGQPSPSPVPERDAGTPVITARIALARAVHSLRPLAAGVGTTAASTHPAIGHLADAANNLTAGRDLLQTHFACDPAGTRTSKLVLGAAHHVRADDRRAARRAGRLHAYARTLDRAPVRCPAHIPCSAHLRRARPARRRTTAAARRHRDPRRPARALPLPRPSPATWRSRQHPAVPQPAPPR